MMSVTYFKTKKLFSGTQTIMDFDNGYGVSIVEHEHSYGLEVAIRKGDNLCYDTPITDDVIGYCSDEQVANIINKVAQLR